MPKPKADRPKYSLTLRGTRYYVQWWEDGRKQRVSCGTAIESEARRFLAEFKANLDTPIIPATPTVGAILDGYLAERAPRTHSATTAYCCATLKRHLDDLPVELLKKAQVRRYTDAHRKEGPQGASAVHSRTQKPLSDGSLHRELGTLRAALAWAVREEWITYAPYIERPSAPPARERWLTREEGERLLQAAMAPHIKVFIYLALFTGARAGH